MRAKGRSREKTDTIFAFVFHLTLRLRFRVLHWPVMELLRAPILHSEYTQEFLTLKVTVTSEEQKAVRIESCERCWPPSLSECRQLPTISSCKTIL